MKKFLLATTALCFSGGATMAADIAVAPSAAPAVSSSWVGSWAGFYLGVHGGYGWGNNDFSAVLSTNPLLAVGGIKSRGALYGGQAGYNWQYGRGVAGVELDFSAAGINGSTASSSAQGISTDFDSRSDQIKYLGTARARLGWLLTDNVLLYGTAGLGWERVDRIETRNQTIGAVFANQTIRTPFDRFGWVAGAGAEVALWNTNWVGRIEYLHYDFGATELTQSFVFGTPGFSSFDRAGRQTIEAVRAGLSYKFGIFGPAPSVSYTKAPVAAAPSSWAGFYLGVHGGYGWADDPFSRFVGADVLNGSTYINGVKSAGWVAGGHVGHNWQFDRVVAGLELDLSGADLRGSSTAPLVASGGGTVTGNTLTDNVKYLGTARGRIGWLPTGNILLYGTAGLAWERIEQSNTAVADSGGGGFITTIVTTNPFNRFGAVVGLGAESLIAGSNWVARIEYLHYDFGRASANTTATTNFHLLPYTSFAESSGRQTIDVVRGGVSYKFGDPALVAAVSYARAPAMASPSTWAGFYLGVHGGYGWKDNDFSLQSGFGTRYGGIKSKGWLGGGQAGYNWQYGRVVAGLEADLSVTGIKGDADPLIGNAGQSSFTLSDNVKYLGTSRGRLGWLPVDNLLVYGTAGLAWERVNRTETSIDLTPPGSASVKTTARNPFGWVAGVGAETMLWNSNWIARLEYLHYDFGTVESTSSFSSTDPTVRSTADRGGRQTIEVARAGISYKFGADGPLVAKY